MLSMLSNMLGLNSLSQKFDNAVIRDRVGSTKMVEAQNIRPNNIILPEISAKPTIKMNADKPYANARHYLLADMESSKVIISNNAEEQVPIASTTKIMTAVVALENYKLDEIITISETASSQVGADTFLRPGEKISLEQLLNCLLIKSGNDSAYAIAEHMNNQDETGILKFVQKMNEKARELHMNNTNYEDPAGLNTTGYSSAYDLYLITRYALKIDKFAEIVKKESAVAVNVDNNIWHELKNSNRLVAEYKYPGAIGVKTGYMPEAGHCLVGAATREGHTLIAVVLNTYEDTPSASADEARRILDWGFLNIEWK